MTQYGYSTAITIRDDDVVVGRMANAPRPRLEAAGLMTLSITDQVPDIWAWMRHAPVWQDAEGRRYRIACTDLRQGDYAQMPMLLAIVCSDGDPSRLVLTSTHAAAYASDGELLGAYTLVRSPAGLIDPTTPTPPEALAALGLSPLPAEVP